MTEEIFDIVNEEGEVIGQAPRSQCHGDPSLLHRVAHVLVFNSRGQLALQLRGPHKDIQPNRWDTSVGGHFDRGETPEQAAAREMKEELGIEAELTFLYRYLWRSTVESELVYTFVCRHDGPLMADPGEISKVRWWSAEEIDNECGRGALTPNFELEWQHYNAYVAE